MKLIWALNLSKRKWFLICTKLYLKQNLGCLGWSPFVKAVIPPEHPPAPTPSLPTAHLPTLDPWPCTLALGCQDHVKVFLSSLTAFVHHSRTVVWTLAIRHCCAVQQSGRNWILVQLFTEPIRRDHSVTARVCCISSGWRQRDNGRLYVWRGPCQGAELELLGAHCCQT